MVSKPLLLLGLSLAAVLLITSEVVARDLAENAAEKNPAEARTETNGVEESKYGGGGYGGGGGGHYGCGGCRYGCCRCGYRCQRCCRYAGEAVDAETEDKPHN